MKGNKNSSQVIYRQNSKTLRSQGALNIAKLIQKNHFKKFLFGEVYKTLPKNSDVRRAII